MSDEELKVQDAIVNGLIDHYKAVIEQYKAENSEDKIIRRTLENFMRGLWEEIQVGELEYTTSEVYEMLEREIFTDNHVAIPSKNTEIQGDDRWLLHFGQNISIPSTEPKTGYWIAQNIHNCHTDFKCSECGYIHNFIHLYGEPTADYTYCPNCGCRMVDEQESEYKE